jgi:hypothetical protein
MSEIALKLRVMLTISVSSVHGANTGFLGLGMECLVSLDWFKVIGEFDLHHFGIDWFIINIIA